MTDISPRADLAAIPSAHGSGWRFTVGQYVALTKPRVVELLLVTTVPVMFLAGRAVPSLMLVLATVVGGALSAGAANTFNCVFDRDIDQVMHRTSSRPLVTGTISPRAAMVFGFVLTVASTVILAAAVNLLAAALSLAAIAFYVFGYTMVLKRRTPQNIVWGGAAGCMPVLIGWAAVTGSLSLTPVVLFLVVFFWTPPHYWPLSMRFRDDYIAASVPMLPVVAGQVGVARQIVAYSWAMVVASLLLVLVAPMGWIYLVVSLGAGGLFLAEAHRLLALASRGASERELRPMRLFHYSISYISLVFVAVAVDPLLYFALPGVAG